LGQHRGEFATTPLRIEGAMVQGVLIDEAIKVHCEFTGHFGRSTGAPAVDEALDTFIGKTMDPLA